MSINENLANEEMRLISQAVGTNCQELLKHLSDSVYMNVRKAVARNSYTKASIINKMAVREKASSVLYWLLKNPNCHLQRELKQDDLAHKCVTCSVCELKLQTECLTCTR